MHQTVLLGILLRLAAGYIIDGSFHRILQQTSIDTPPVQPAKTFDVVILGCGVGGHAAALHAVSNGLKVAVVSAPSDIGGTCVNRGCVPSKALLAASYKYYSLKNEEELKKFGIKMNGRVSFDREVIANHAKGLASSIRNSIESSLKKNGVELVHGTGQIISPHQVQTGNQIINGQHIIVAPGSVPSVPRGIQIDGVNVFTSDHAVNLERIPEWLLIIGGGYIGLEFAEIYSSLGAEVTIVDAMGGVLATFDKDIAALADKLIAKQRGIEVIPNVIAKEIIPGEPNVRPTIVKLADTATGEIKQTLEVDGVLVATGRHSNAQTLHLENVNVELKRGNFVPVDPYMRVLNNRAVPVPGLYCIGDANGIMMLAHAASAQGISVIETILGRDTKTNHKAIPAAAFTHPEVASVGLTELEAANESKRSGFEFGKVVAHFKANTKGLAEFQSGGMAKLLWRKDSGQVLGAQMIGPHASDLMQQIANAISTKQTVQALAYIVHAHPTLSEVCLELYKKAVGLLAH